MRWLSRIGHSFGHFWRVRMVARPPRTTTPLATITPSAKHRASQGRNCGCFCLAACLHSCAVLKSDGGRGLIMDGSGFIQGVWCGAIFGAAVMMLIVSLIFENSQRRQERQVRVMHKIWDGGDLTVSVLPVRGESRDRMIG